MAEGGGGGEERQKEDVSSASWWDTWVRTAREKGSSVLEFVKKDLEEFTTTLQQETSGFVSNTAATLRDKLKMEEEDSTANVVKRSVSGFLDSVSNAMIPSKETESEPEEAFVIRDSEPVVLDRYQLQLVLLSRAESTYLEEVETSKQEDYEAWLSTFDLVSRQEELVELMATNVDVRSMYGRLVPTKVSHVVFWHRYFYRVAQLVAAEERRNALKRRAVQQQGADELELRWDEDDELDHPDLTTQEMDRLLNDYQKECEERAAAEAALSHSISDPGPIQRPQKDVKCPERIDEDLATLNMEDDPVEGDTPANAVTTATNAIVSGSDSSESSKDTSTLGDDWEKDFDVNDDDLKKVSQSQDEQKTN